MAEADRFLTSLEGVFKKLRVGKNLSDAEISYLRNKELSPVQQSAIVTWFCNVSKKTTAEKNLLKYLRSDNLDILLLLGENLDEREAQRVKPLPNHWLKVYSSVKYSEKVGAKCIGQIVKDIISSDKADRWAAGLLVLICLLGVSDEDTRDLTLSMADSGDRIDYRMFDGTKKAKLVRRYPTGALSEKVSLILPSLLIAARKDVDVASPFLVAKSLSHTGGTWDKLSSIPGFTFPQPGEEVERCLNNCGVAMVVTHGNINPADRKLYQLRSATGTVENKALIVSSIASKHLAMPVHRLLLDIRIGKDSFIKSVEEAIDIGDGIKILLEREKIKSSYTITRAIQPNGMAVGNALEVAESIAVMGGNTDRWDVRALLEQKQIVIDFFAKLMAAEFDSKSVQDWAHYGYELFSNGSVLRGFQVLLKEHGVTTTVVRDLIESPFVALGISTEPIKVVSKSDGVMNSVNQVQIGEFVNRELGGAGNDYEGEFSSRSGIILSKRLGDIVRSGDELFSVYGVKDSDIILNNNFEEYFEIT